MKTESNRANDVSYKFPRSHEYSDRDVPHVSTRIRLKDRLNLIFYHQFLFQALLNRFRFTIDAKIVNKKLPDLESFLN